MRKVYDIQDFVYNLVELGLSIKEVQIIETAAAELVMESSVYPDIMSEAEAIKDGKYSYSNEAWDYIHSDS